MVLKKQSNLILLAVALWCCQAPYLAAYADDCSAQQQMAILRLGIWQDGLTDLLGRSMRDGADDKIATCVGAKKIRDDIAAMRADKSTLTSFCPHEHADLIESSKTTYDLAKSLADRTCK